MERLNYNRKPLYNSARDLFHRTSNRLLLGALTLDAALGNSSVAYAQEARNNSQSPHDGTWAMYTCIGLMYVAVSSATKDRKAKIGFGLAGLAFCAAGLVSLLK